MRDAPNALKKGTLARGYHVIGVRRNAQGQCYNARLKDGEPGFFELQYPLLWPPGFGGWHAFRREAVMVNGQQAVDEQRQPLFHTVQAPY